MRRHLEQVIKDIKEGENLDIYIMGCLAFVIAILGLLGQIPTEWLTAAILATLSILSFSMLATRRLFAELSKSVDLLRPTSDMFLRDRSLMIPFAQRIANTDSIWLFGPSLISVFTPNIGTIREKIQNGADIRVLVFDVSSPHLSLMAEQLGVRVDLLRQDINTTLQACHQCHDWGLGRGKLEVRLVQGLPGYSMVVLDSSRGTGQIIVEYIGLQSDAKRRPHIDLHATHDPRWFPYYREQFDKLWDSAKPYILAPTKKP